MGDIIYYHLYCIEFDIAFCMIENCNHCSMKKAKEKELRKLALEKVS